MSQSHFFLSMKFISDAKQVNESKTTRRKERVERERFLLVRSSTEFVGVEFGWMLAVCAMYVVVVLMELLSALDFVDEIPPFTNGFMRRIDRLSLIVVDRNEKLSAGGHVCSSSCVDALVALSAWCRRQ